MPSLTEWRVPPAYQPHASDYAFDLDHVLSSIVGLHSIIPPDAFTAEAQSGQELFPLIDGINVQAPLHESLARFRQRSSGFDV